MANITSKIEGIKSALRFSRDVKTDYERERRSTLLAFHDSAIDLLYESLSANFGDYPVDGGKSLFRYQKTFTHTVSSILKTYQRLILYFPAASALLKHANEIADAAIECRKVAKGRLGPAKDALRKEDLAHRSQNHQHYKDAVALSNTVNAAYWGEMRPFADRLREAFRNYIANANVFLAHHDST